MNVDAIANDLAWDKPLLDYTQYRFDKAKTKIARNAGLIGICLSFSFFVIGIVV